jgi:hypothetical protein
MFLTSKGDLLVKLVIVKILVSIGLSLLLISHSWSDGNIDVLPQGFMADANTPFAVHFTVSNSFFSGHSVVTAKVRVLPSFGGITANNYTWSVTGISGWRNDEASLGILPTLTVTNDSVSGWLFAESLSNSYLGTSTCTIRFYTTSVTFMDVTSNTSFYAWNSTTNAGWLVGTYYGGANYLALAEDSNNNILGSYITESTGLAYNYTGLKGYFKMAVPVGTVSNVEFRNFNNQTVGNISGPWTITANTVTTIPKITTIPSKYWINNP